MNPWGLLSSDASREYRGQIHGQARWSELKEFLQSIGTSASAESPDWLRTDTVQLASAVFGNVLYLTATTTAHTTLRLDSRASPAPLTTTAIETQLQSIAAGRLDAGLLHKEDNYYYGHKQEVPLPVYRAILDDEQRTRLYIHPDTGALRIINSTGRWSRWIRTGLHDMDFPVLRLRPIWDIVVMLLLSGVTLVCATGTWMAFRRIRRDWRKFRRFA
jgi:hypothetical protein